MKTKEILPKQQLEYLYSVKKYSDNQIAKQYGLTLGQVHRLRNSYRIRTLEQYERHPVSTLNKRETSILIGKMLGDGHLRKKRGKQTYPCLMIEHSVKQKEYVYWQKNELKRWLYNEEKPIKTNRKKRNNKTYHSLSFTTVSHPAFNEVYEDFYKSGKKRVGKKTIKKYFTLLSLAVWVMDDGFLSGKNKRIGLATNSFTLPDVKFLKDFLHNRFDLKCWICKRTNTKEITWELHFDKPSTRKISEMIELLVIDSMKHKLLSETTKGAG